MSTSFYFDARLFFERQGEGVFCCEAKCNRRCELMNQAEDLKFQAEKLVALI